MGRRVSPFAWVLCVLAGSVVFGLCAEVIISVLTGEAASGGSVLGAVVGGLTVTYVYMLIFVAIHGRAAAVVSAEPTEETT